MIVKPTVFVLGAGASVPYGFPTGPELADEVCRHFEDMAPPGHPFRDTEFSLALMGAFNDHGVSIPLIQQFAPAFRLAGCDSLDEFVQPPGNRRFLNLVKAAIITTLLRREEDGRLTDANKREADWFRYLFKHLRTEDYGSFFANKVKVITFNFDRSFERRLFLTLRAYYGIGDDEATRLRGVIPVLHLHGKLGGEEWLGERRPESRAYTTAASTAQKLALLDAIKIVHEELDPRDIATAQTWLREAQVICFLGFGFHRLTLSRLGVDQKLPLATIFGTTKGLSGPELRRIKNDFGNRVDNSLRLDEGGDRDAFQYLKDVHVLFTDRG